MFRIILQRFGRKNKPFFRIVGHDTKSNNSTKNLGYFCPLNENMSIDVLKLQKLIETGAKISKNLYYRMKFALNKNIIVFNDDNMKVLFTRLLIGKNVD